MLSCRPAGASHGPFWRWILISENTQQAGRLFITDTRLTLGHGDLPDPERLLPTKYVQDRQPALEDPAVPDPYPATIIKASSNSPGETDKTGGAS
jgi:hypothetical protein